MCCSVKFCAVFTSCYVCHSVSHLSFPLIFSLPNFLFHFLLQLLFPVHLLPPNFLLCLGCTYYFIYCPLPVPTSDSYPIPPSADPRRMAVNDAQLLRVIESYCVMGRTDLCECTFIVLYVTAILSKTLVICVHS